MHLILRAHRIPILKIQGIDSFPHYGRSSTLLAAASWILERRMVNFSESLKSDANILNAQPMKSQRTSFRARQESPA